jgi:hypothetical protein
MNHSQFPTQKYVTNSLRDRKTTKWIASSTAARYEALLDKPTRETLDLLQRQYEQAKQELQASRNDLETLRAHLSENDYEELSSHLPLIWVEAFRLFSLSTFALRLYQQLPAEHTDRATIKMEILSSLTSLRALASDPWLNRYVFTIYPRPATELSTLLVVCNEIESGLGDKETSHP